MAGPGLVIVAGAITVWLAVDSYDGLVSDDYYKQGLAVNQRIHRDKEAGRHGAQAELIRSDNNLRLFLRMKDGSALPPSIVVKITHPTRAGLDQNLTLVAEGQGLYAGKLTSDISGRWHVVLEDTAGQWRLMGDWRADQAEPLLLVASEVSSN